MKDKYFKLFKWVVAIWSTLMIISSLSALVLSNKIADQWFDYYYSNNTALHKSVMKLSNNETHFKIDFGFALNLNNRTYNDRNNENEAIREAFKSAFIIVLVIVAMITVFFNVAGLIGSIKQIYCLSLTYAIYMTTATVVLFINSLAFKYEWIFTVKYCIITVAAYCLVSGIRERRFRSSEVGVVTYGKQDMGTNSTLNGLYIQQNTCPPQEIFKVDSPMTNSYVLPPSVLPPPLPPPPLPSAPHLFTPPLDFHTVPKW